MPKQSDTHCPLICHYLNTPHFNDLTRGTRSILLESQVHHFAGEDDPGGAGDKASVIDIVSNASHHLVAFVNPISTGMSADRGDNQTGGENTAPAAQETNEDTGIPYAQALNQPARAHSTSPRALHGRSPPVGVVPTDRVAASAISHCMPGHVSRDDYNVK